MNERVLISGASIAGLTTAYWLSRYGFQPTLVERTPELSTGGNGVDVRGHAGQVVEQMGLMPRVRELVTDVRGIKFVNAADKAVARVSTEAMDPYTVEIMRGDLLTLLCEASGAQIRYGDSLQALEQDEKGVDVTFETGPAERFDLVVGADGMHSNVRQLAFGSHTDFVRHKGHYFAFADADAGFGEDRWVTMFNTPGRMVGIYRSGNHPQARSYFAFRSEPLDYDHRDVSEHRQLVSDAFAGQTAWHTRELLDSALADPGFYFDACAQIHMPSWSTGRIVLVGDAAWCPSPVSGTGAELALVGAYHLAGQLATAAGDHHTAFARYDATLRPLVAARQQVGPNLALMVPKTDYGRHVRNVLARSPLMKAASAADRYFQAKRMRPLPEYTPAP